MLRASPQLSVMEPLDLRLLPDEGLRFEEALRPDWLEGQLFDPASAEPLHTRGPGHAELEVQPLGPVQSRPPIRIKGTLIADVATICVRCLEPVAERIEAEVDVTLFAEEAKAPGAAADDEEGLDDSQKDEGTYAGSAIDLPALLREALILEVAMNPVCPDEITCDERTAKMLEEANAAADGVIPDCWAALRRLTSKGDAS